MIRGIEDTSRDDWMRRTGPFYPMLVAFQLQSSLPVARSLEPSEEDVARARPWLPIVGLALGASLAIAAALFDSLLSPVVVAALVVGGALIASGARFEVGLARLGEDRGAAGGGWSAGPVAVPLVVAIAVGLLLRYACLVGIETASWTGALITTQVVARWAMLAVLAWPGLLAARRSSGGASEAEEGEAERSAARPPWVPFALATGLTALIAGVAGRGAGMLALVLAACAAGVVIFMRRGREQGSFAGEGEAADGVAAVVEAAAFLSFAWLASVG